MPSNVRLSDYAAAVLRQLADERGITLSQAIDVVTAEWRKKTNFEDLSTYMAMLSEDLAEYGAPSQPDDE